MVWGGRCYVYLRMEQRGRITEHALVAHRLGYRHAALLKKLANHLFAEHTGNYGRPDGQARDLRRHDRLNLGSHFSRQNLALLPNRWRLLVSVFDHDRVRRRPDRNQLLLHPHHRFFTNRARVDLSPLRDNRPSPGLRLDRSDDVTQPHDNLRTDRRFFLPRRTEQ